MKKKNEIVRMEINKDETRTLDKKWTVEEEEGFEIWSEGEVLIIKEDKKIKPNERNSCSGRFADWLEVNLLSKCNAKCAWCVEKDGFHPEEKATWQEIAK